jgi:C4-dicarboxylate-specific signal transduction histidine kinase
MRIGIKTTLLLATGYALLTAAFALGVRDWIASLEDHVALQTVALLAREQAALLSETNFEALIVPDSVSRRRLAQRVRDTVLLSEVVSALTIVDRQGHVLASEPPSPTGELPPAEVLFRRRMDPIVEPRPALSLGSGNYVVSLPLVYQERLLGYVRISFHNARVAMLYGEARRKLFLTALLGLLGVALLGLLLQMQIVRRAASISRTLEDSPPPRRRRLLFTDPADELARALAAAGRVRNALNEATQKETRLEQSFGAISQVFKMGVLVLRHPGEVDFANPRALQLLGATTPDDVQVIWSRLCAEHGLSFSAPLKPEQIGRPVMFGVPTPDGGRQLQAEIYPVGGGSSDHVVLLSDRSMLEALEADVRLAGYLESLARVYRSAAHDLRAPLSAIMINLDLLRESMTGADGEDAEAVRQRQDRYVTVLRDELTRLNTSLSQILTQTSPPSDRQERFDLRAPLQEIARLLGPQARRQNVELALQLPDRELPLQGYRDRLKQALLNIAINALEAMAKGGSLSIDVAADDLRARIAIADSGPGIPREVLGRIYESDYTTKVSGSGIGLYVARALIELHGGTIETHSEEGRGTTVALDLPLAVD